MQNNLTMNFDSVSLKKEKKKSYLLYVYHTNQHGVPYRPQNTLKKNIVRAEFDGVKRRHEY